MKMVSIPINPNFLGLQTGKDNSYYKRNALTSSAVDKTQVSRLWFLFERHLRLCGIQINNVYQLRVAEITIITGVL